MKILKALVAEARRLAYNYSQGNTDSGVITGFSGKYFVGEKRRLLEAAIKKSPTAAEECLREIY